MGVTYERGAGGHVAERLRPVPGSDEAAALEALAADPASGWRRIEDEPAEPARPARSGKKETA